MVSEAPIWADVEAGMSVGPYTATITEQLVQDYCAALGVPARTYLSPADDGPSYMPPMLPAAWYIHLLKDRLHLGYGLMARHGMQAHDVVRIGERLTATGRLIEKYERKGRHYWTLEYEMRGEDGGLRQTHRLTATVD